MGFALERRWVFVCCAAGVATTSLSYLACSSFGGATDAPDAAPETSPGDDGGATDGAPPLDAGDAAVDAARTLTNCGTAGAVDTAHDPLNCGSCGHECGPGMQCAQRHCVALPGLVTCDAGGVPAACEPNDPRACATAGNAPCATNQYCTDKSCIAFNNLDLQQACEPPLFRCTAPDFPSPGGASVTSVGGCYTGKTALNCKTCGVACGPGEACVGGACAAFTPSLNCLGTCRNDCCPSGTVCCPSPGPGSQVLCVNGSKCLP